MSEAGELALRPEREVQLRKRRLVFVLAGATFAAGLIGPIAAGAASGSHPLSPGQSGVKGLPQRIAHPGYASANTGYSPARVSSAAGPTIGASWNGISDSSVSPPDPNGAIGPSSYVEVINLKIAIYNRTGGTIASATLGTLTGHSNINLS